MTAGCLIAALVMLFLAACLVAWLEASDAQRARREQDAWIAAAARAWRQRELIERRCRDLEELLGVVEKTVEKWRRKP